MTEPIKIAVIGLGYVGLPVALAFAEKFPSTIGFDIDEEKVAALRDGQDHTGEVSSETLLDSSLHFTASSADLQAANIFIVGVPTPVDENHRPDLTMLVQASELVGSVLRPGSIVVYESTVYPGVTEEICGPVLEQSSGLKQGKDFKLAYSPERINPGDREHTLTKITKVVSGEDKTTCARVAEIYGEIVEAGIHQAASIKVAEAAKVIENTQRDLNIALMNELALIFDRLDIPTREVLATASTKWNFLRFVPGLVGGHCIGVDPFYLTTKAEQLGYHPQVILAGRRINDGMGQFVAQKMIKLLIRSNPTIDQMAVGILGLTFKENVPDLRNSRVPSIFHELEEFGVKALIYDPLISAAAAEQEYGLKLNSLDEFRELDGVILAVNHTDFYNPKQTPLMSMVRRGGVFIDVKSVLRPEQFAGHCTYWSL